MNTYLSLPKNFIFPIFHLLIMSKYIKTFLGKKQHTGFGNIIWLIYYIFLVIAEFNSQLPSKYLLIGNILCVFLSTILYPSGSLKTRCIFTLLVCTLWMFVEVIVLVLIRMANLNEDNLRFVGETISMICLLIIVVIVNRYMHRKISRDISIRYFFIILLIPLSNIYLIHHIVQITNQHKEYSLFAILSCFLFLLISYVIFEVYDWMVRDADILAQNRLYEQQLHLCNRQAEERENFYLELRRMKHDMKIHLLGIMGMIQSNETKKAEEYINQLLDTELFGKPTEISHSGNIVIDSLINYKFETAQKEGITLNVNILLPNTLPFQDGQLAIVFGNLLENAIEACSNLAREKRYISLNASYSKEVLFITICNPYLGKLKKNKNGKYITTKTETSQHGFGLASIERTVSYYNGQIIISDENEQFNVTVIMYGTNSDK